MYARNSVAMVFLASSKLPPLAVTDRLLQSPFQPSSSDQKSQSIAMPAVTRRFTTSEFMRYSARAQAPGDVSEDLGLHNPLFVRKRLRHTENVWGYEKRKRLLNWSAVSESGRAFRTPRALGS